MSLRCCLCSLVLLGFFFAFLFADKACQQFQGDTDRQRNDAYADTELFFKKGVNPKHDRDIAKKTKEGGKLGIFISSNLCHKDTAFLLVM